jgi:hypothetical protein
MKRMEKEEMGKEKKLKFFKISCSGFFKAPL